MLQIHILSEPQNHRCCYCGHQMTEINLDDMPIIPRDAMTREHVIPRSYNGEGRENLVAACRLCNELRGNMDAIAFYNLQQKWFKRDETLRARWHKISVDEYQHFKQLCLRTQERHLRGLARRHIEYAYRHQAFIYHNRERLRA